MRGRKNKSYSNMIETHVKLTITGAKGRTFFLHPPFSSRLFYREYFSESLSAVKTASCLKSTSAWASFSGSGSPK